MEFLDLPVELIERILIICDPIDVSKVAQTCRFVHFLICFSANPILWRELYLMQDLDDPRECVGHDGKRRLQIDWKNELQCIIRARTVLEHPISMRSQELECILQTLIMLVCHIKPCTSPDSWIPGLSKNLEWVAKGLQRGLLDRIQVPEELHSLHQLAARLHTYYGLTKNDARRSSFAESRAFVYLLRNYLPENEYGPFMPDGSVNWVHLCAIRHVVSSHLAHIDEDTHQEIDNKNIPVSLAFTQICLPQGVDLDSEPDWAGLTGAWTVAFCFCDHRELLRFNEMSVREIETKFFELPQFHEAYRSLDVQLSVTRTEPDPFHPTRPMIYFSGEMSSSSTSKMTGRIKMTKDNQVQWQFVSGEQGHSIWSSEGVQVGGLQSFYGVLGSWTTVFHDADDPVGPFWMHKLRSDEW